MDYLDEVEQCIDCGLQLISDDEYQELEISRTSMQEEYRNMKTVQVHSVQGKFEADIIQTYLRSRGIESLTQGLAVHSVHPFTVDGMGEIRILVLEKDAEEAKRAIADYLESDSGLISSWL